MTISPSSLRCGEVNKHCKLRSPEAFGSLASTVQKYSLYLNNHCIKTFKALQIIITLKSSLQSQDVHCWNWSSHGPQTTFDRIGPSPWWSSYGDLIFRIHSKTIQPDNLLISISTVLSVLENTKFYPVQN